MIFIDVEHRCPTDTDIQGWTPWSQDRWDRWLQKSKALMEALAKHDAAGERAARNDLIDANSSHWGELKEWLLALSNKKCWFSEAKELFSHYEVEHFRPKKEARGLDGTVRDGYWWLAFDYMNFRLCGSVGNRKKGGWFPLLEGSPCSVYSSQCEESEMIYLLDPTDAADVALLAFDEEGKAVCWPGCSQSDQRRVVESVKRLKLNEHVQLAEARRKVWQRISNLMGDYNRAKARIGANNPVAKADMRKAAKEIYTRTRPDAELSAVARCCVLLGGDHELSRLLA
jgi:hypothetical protein